MRQRILVTGANGFVGRRVVAALLENGHVVQGGFRSTSSAIGAPAVIGRSVVGEIGPHTDWSAAMAGVECVVHLASRVHVMLENKADPLAAFRRVNVEGSRRLVEEASRSGVRRLVFVSSIKVNGEATFGTPFSIAAPPAPTDPYGISKWEAEQMLRAVSREEGIEIVIVRPPLVYGPGVRGNFFRLLAGVARGMPFPLGAIQNERTLLFVGNLADALVRTVNHPAAAGQTFLLSDGKSISTPDLIRSIAHALGRKPRLLKVPLVWLEGAGRVLGKQAAIQRLVSSLQIDNQHIQETLDWAPPFTLEQGFAATAEWWYSRGRH